MSKRINYLGISNKINTEILPDSYENLTKIKGLLVEITDSNKDIKIFELIAPPVSSEYVFVELNGQGLRCGLTNDFTLQENKVILNPLIELYPEDLITIKYFL